VVVTIGGVDDYGSKNEWEYFVGVVFVVFYVVDGSG
jgi:hypothetical protein